MYKRQLFDCSGNIGLAERLLRAFDSQVAGGKQYDRAAVGRWYANATFLESHETDGSPAISYGIDLTPLLDGVYAFDPDMMMYQ